MLSDQTKSLLHILFVLDCPLFLIFPIIPSDKFLKTAPFLFVLEYDRIVE